MRLLLTRFCVLLSFLFPLLASAVTPMVAAGAFHSLALKADGTVVAWGSNSTGQLGDGTTMTRVSPVAVPGLTGVVAVAAGSSYSVALKADGTLWAWGTNSDGQLGDGSTTSRTSPVAVTGLTGVVAVEAGYAHSVALKADGTVVAWGSNSTGQLGDGTNTSRTSPVAVPGLTGVVAVALGSYHSVALKTDGMLWAWGNNGSGQLGDGTRTQRTSPVAVPGLTGVVAVAAGQHQSIALKADSTHWAWGSSGTGGFGDGTLISSTSPVAVLGLTEGVAAAVGFGHSVALKLDGTLSAWGYNVFGQLGDGTTITRTSPMAVPGLTGVIAVAAGDYHSVALKADGTLWAWGNNVYGQLGDGTTNYRSIPVVVSGGTLGVGVSELTTSPASLTFDGVNGSAAQTLTLTNTGSSALNNLIIGVSADFARTSNCGLTLAPGTSCTITITFTPRATGSRSGTLAVVGNGVIQSSVSLSGTSTGALAVSSATALSFGVQNMGSTSAAQTVTLSNTGNATLNIATIVASSEYGVTHTCGAGLGVNGSCLLSITFSPTAMGSRSGTVTLTDDAFNSPQTITLTGTGQGAVASLSAATLTFASQNEGSSSAARDLTLTNTGGAELNIASISVSGDFAQTNTCGATLAKEASCTISVSFLPTAVGVRSGSLIVSTDALGSPSTVSLSGTGLAVGMVSLSSTSLVFAPGNVGTPSAAQTVTLTNSGAAALSLSGIVASGDFSQTNNCGAGLGVGGFCSISVTFTPTASGARNGAITISSNAVGSPSSLNLTGTGVAIAQTIGSISFTSSTLAVGGTTAVSAIATSGVPVTFNSTTTGVCTVSGSTVTGLAAGTCTITANQAGNATYNAAPQVSQNITISKMSQTLGIISFSPATLHTGGTTTASAAATSGLAVSFSSTTPSTCTVSGSTVTGVSVGTCTISASQVGNATYLAATPVAQNITVGAGSSGNLFTRYRLYNDGTKEHLYTTDLNEYSVLSTGGGWLAEGAIYKLFQGAGSLAGVDAVPYYRLYNPGSHQHHWTTDFNEYTVLGTLGWSKEGIDGYILPTAVAGSVPLFRLYLNALGGLHLWTTDANERNVLTTTAGWVDEGVAGYVVPLQ